MRRRQRTNQNEPRSQQYRLGGRRGGWRRGKRYSSKLLSASASFSSEWGVISTTDSSPATDHGSDWFLSLPGENFPFSFWTAFVLFSFHGQWFLRHFWLWFQPQRDTTHHHTLLLLSWLMSPVLPAFLFSFSQALSLRLSLPYPFLSLFFPSFLCASPSSLLEWE